MVSSSSTRVARSGAWSTRSHPVPADRGRNRTQHGVSCVVSVEVVDLLKVVDIDPDERELLVSSFRRGGLTFHLFTEVASIGKFGQIVDARQGSLITRSGLTRPLLANCLTNSGDTP